jgi:hypothetical protein
VVTLRFSFNRNGKLIGPPMVTAINISGDDAARQTFVEAAKKALEGCTPLNFSPKLGAVIGGTVFTMRFASRPTGRRSSVSRPIDSWRGRGRAERDGITADSC